MSSQREDLAVIGSGPAGQKGAALNGLKQILRSARRGRTTGPFTSNANTTLAAHRAWAAEIRLCVSKDAALSA